MGLIARDAIGSGERIGDAQIIEAESIVGRGAREQAGEHFLGFAVVLDGGGYFA